jgi:hypothetical protein
VFFDLFVEAGENTLRAARLLSRCQKWLRAGLRETPSPSRRATDHHDIVQRVNSTSSP